MKIDAHVMVTRVGKSSRMRSSHPLNMARTKLARIARPSRPRRAVMLLERNMTFCAYLIMLRSVKGMWLELRGERGQGKFYGVTFECCRIGILMLTL